MSRAGVSAEAGRVEGLEGGHHLTGTLVTRGGALFETPPDHGSKAGREPFIEGRGIVPQHRRDVLGR